MAAPLVINSSNLYLSVIDPSLGSWAPTINLSCDAVALEITPNVDDIDIGTFCSPSATESGRVTYSAVAALLWSADLYTRLAAHVGELLWVKYVPVPADQTQLVKFQTRYAALPWGRFELGQRVEVDLPLAVLSTPVYVDLP